MFCSNQKFSVCGNKRDTKALEKSLDLIINGFDVPFRYYSIGEEEKQEKLKMENGKWKISNKKPRF